ncbi:hypothetical protein [Seonamhaeicola sp. ML3]|uniref:hypothetical protein n=1 Tax=Seonamhaeicola sp. ML3 TaxID=2937786 RepID=UPI00200EA182|nr:hypothetical protein [Seonamhaeicola sp. ML3]
MTKYIAFILVALSCLLVQAQKMTPTDLNAWTFWGQGSKQVMKNNMFFMKEDPLKSSGVMIVSPKSYSNKVTIKYDVMTLTPASVLVAMMSVSDMGDSNNISLPHDYDGAMGLWIHDKESYFYAFRNAPHNKTPFIRKYPAIKGESPDLVSLDKNIMHPGIFYSIEIGQDENQIWLKVDGETILKTTDKNALTGGHVAFRIRGTAGEYAACLIRNLEIQE